MIDGIDLQDLHATLRAHAHDNAMAAESSGVPRSIRLAHFLYHDTIGAEMGETVKFSQTTLIGDQT